MTEGIVAVLGPSPSPSDVEHPSYDALKRLYCRNGGQFLRVLPGGAVDGIRQETDAYSKNRGSLGSNETLDNN